MIADIEELEEMLHARRLKAKELTSPMKGDSFIFPVADETVKTAGGDRRLRPSTSSRGRPEQEESFSRRIRQTFFATPLQDDSTRDDAEANNDFWSFTGDFICRHL